MKEVIVENKKLKKIRSNARRIVRIDRAFHVITEEVHERTDISLSMKKRYIAYLYELQNCLTIPFY